MVSVCAPSASWVPPIGRVTDPPALTVPLARGVSPSVTVTVPPLPPVPATDATTENGVP